MQSRQAIERIIVGCRLTQMTRVAAELGVADIIESKTKSVDAIAAECEADTESLYRLLRGLSRAGIFQEYPDQGFGHTEMSRWLCRSRTGNVAAMAIHYGSEWVWKPWGELLNAVKYGESGSELALGKNLFEYLSTDVAAEQVFEDYMAGVTEIVAEEFTATYDVSNPLTVVDVGGGLGSLLAAILECSPSSRGILYDLPNVASEARERLLQRGLLDRCTVVGGDFFERVPSGGDLYALKWIVHDWSDADAIRILRNCRAAMGDSSRLVLVEFEISGDRDEAACLMDLQMMVLLRGRERTRDEFKELLSKANLRLETVYRLPSGFSIFEAGIGS